MTMLVYCCFVLRPSNFYQENNMKIRALSHYHERQIAVPVVSLRPRPPSLSAVVRCLPRTTVTAVRPPTVS